eukprot:TRINITY_DN552_c0_g1_i1.p1 TRINITY_DN552_c0_g1~~TRINITY_DN552_c0_g1_i1.p1  ORF type:complete len:484 (+),score=53.58 TRINITY_DN552_c0_g1_i1:103-1554(+)
MKFFKALTKLGALSIGFILACIAISIAIRSIGATTNPQCQGIDRKALAIHESIIAGSRGHFFDEIEGHWYVQTTNNWFMHSYANFEVNVTRSQRGAMFAWKWFYSMVLTPTGVTDEIHSDPNGATFLLNVIAPEAVKSFCPVDRPLIILDHKPDQHLTLFDCGIAGVPEGTLFILSRSPMRDDNYVSKIFEDAKTLGVDVLVRTDVPQADSGIFGYLATLSNEGYKFYSLMIIVFLIFSHLCPTETTTIQSFAYTSLWSWNVGVKKFDLQVLLLVLYHTNWFDKLSHMTLLGDLLAWYTIFASYEIGPYLLAAVLALQMTQLYTYKDFKFGVIMTVAYLSLMVLATALVPYVFYCKLFVQCSAVMRVLGHMYEPIPPGLSGSEKFERLTSMSLKHQIVLPFVFFLGIISEGAAGIPCRTFSYVWYIVLARLNLFKSRVLIDVEDCDKITKDIQTHGWKGHEALATVMHWSFADVSTGLTKKLM